MDVNTKNEIRQESMPLQGFYSNISGFSAFQSQLPVIKPVSNPNILQLSKSERLELAMNNLHIGQRIHEELKRQGRTVTWLSQQLCMKRTSLYYTFRQNSIDMQLLLRISAFMNHNFLRDVLDVYDCMACDII